MATITGTHSNIVKAGLDHIFFQTYEKAPTLINSIFHVQSTTHKYEENIRYTAPGLLVEKSEGEDLTESNPQEGYLTRYTPVDFGLYCSITRNLRRNDRYGVIPKVPKAMAKAAMATLEYYGSRVFSQGQSVAPKGMTLGDGQYLFATAHPLKDGSSFANRPSSNVDLTATSLWAGIKSMQGASGDDGLPLNIPAKWLLVPHNEEQKAIELIQSTQYPESAENAVNALRTKGIDYMVWPYWLGSVDADAWYLLADKGTPERSHSLRLYWAEKPWTEGDMDFFSKDYLYSVLMGFSFGYDAPFGVYGSSGA